MAAITFDTLGYSKKLQALGFSREQAEGLAELHKDLVAEGLATKQDLKDLEYRLTVRLGGMMAASIAIVAALVKLT
jgi:hypothetical protein